MFVYGVLYVLTYRGVHLYQKPTHKNWALPFLLCIIYATVDELHQMFTPNRSPTVRDIGYDLLGISIAFLRLHSYI
jgi:VanZ family protein